MTELSKFGTNPCDKAIFDSVLELDAVAIIVSTVRILGINVILLPRRATSLFCWWVRLSENARCTNARHFNRLCWPDTEQCK